jgi:Skp family chaperone for outer membrane proteins
MNELQYNNQALNEYLLGSLPDAEAEHFDELSFTDDEFADALKIAEKDLVDAYIHDELSGATLDKFKTHYLASPMRREKVEFAKAFQVFAGKNIAPAAAEIKTFVETKPKRNLTGLLSSIFTFSRPVAQLGFAFAVLALVFFGGWLWRENSRQQFEMSQANANREQIQQRETELAEREKQLQDEAANLSFAVNSANNSETERELAQVREERARLEQQLKKQMQERQRLAEQRKLAEQQRAEQQRVAQTVPPVSPNRVGIASFILVPSLRGSNRIQSVSIPANTASVAANLELETDEYITYRAVLRSPSDNRILWQSGKLKSNKVGENKRLKLSFPAALLKPQIYSIEVSGIAADGEAEIISDYSFRVVR